MKRIDDEIEPTLMYVNAALDFIVGLVESKSKTNELCCPFAMDLSIAVGAPKEINNNDKEPDGNDDSDDDDDDIPNEAAPTGEYQCYIGDIQKKLDENKLKNVKDELKDIDDGRRAFRESFEKLRESVEKEEKEEKNKYPYRKRFISMIDRRKSKKSDKLDDFFLYEPPHGVYTRDIPKVEASEWYISATRTCLLPNMKYNKFEAIGDQNPKNKGQDDEKNKKPEEDTNVGASFHCKGGLLTFSFHVKAIDQIKCYLFWNGQMIRCFADEIFWILPQLFDMEKEENKTYIKSEEFEILVNNMKAKLKDLKYEAFVNM